MRVEAKLNGRWGCGGGGEGCKRPLTECPKDIRKISGKKLYPSIQMGFVLITLNLSSSIRLLQSGRRV